MLQGDPVTTWGSGGGQAGARQPVARWLLASVLTALIALLSGVAPAAAQQFVFTRYAQPSGLKNLGIEALLVARTGDLWVATDGGMYRYDGTSFTQYDKSRGIPADATLSLAESPSGRIFARVDAGLYSGDADHFEPVLTAEGPVLTDQYTMLIAPADDQVLYLKDHQITQIQRTGGPGSLWKARGLFGPATIAEHPELAAVEGVIRVDGGTLWFGCGLRVCRFDGQKLAVFGATQGVPGAQYGLLLQDRNGNIWARSLDHVVTLAHGANHFQSNDPPHVMLANRVRRMILTLDPMGHVVTRNSIGIARWDGTAWQEFGTQNGLPDQPITQALADSDGNFWLAVSGIGLYQWRGYDNLESWTKDQGLDPESVWNIIRDSHHRLILGTDLGCRTLDDKSHRVVPCPYPGLPEQESDASAVDPSGGFWMSYQTSQLWRVPPGGTRAQRVTTVPDHFDAAEIVFDRSGTGWIAALEYGLAKIDSTTLAVTRMPLPGNPRVDDVVQAADGSIWVGATTGLYRVEGDHFVRIATMVDGQQIGLQTVAAATDGSVWGSRICEKILRLTPPCTRCARMRAAGSGRTPVRAWGSTTDTSGAASRPTMD
jgi:ligand-binding sensor domain-containing protein